MAENINIQVQLIDKSPEVLAAIPKAIQRALWAVGAEAAKSAAADGACPVDTGLLKNSITFAVGGSAPEKMSYRADRPDKSGVIRSGSYSGAASPGDYVLIGSNVEYAAAQELGTSRGIRAKHFLKNAVANGQSRLKAVIRSSFENL